ncbi:olfactory receptor 2G3-like [Talpa occidentalis]|uniref:olfactory receptor 2G3-like n=1 Tax=Talpa occidentalis TaxID=50954 RepID=UPI0018909755|nr:olfactory receptor 2G3-like [Talpa occidentalis]
MDRANQSTPEGFVLLGFSDRPRLEAALFVFVLFFYLLTLLGNSAIVLVSRLDPLLHTPMYFFLSNLSVLDLCFTSSLAPQTLVNLRGPDKTITFGGCVVQLYVSLALGSTECLLLAVMAWDRYVAVCRPLHYAVIMSPRRCQHLAATSWLGGLANSLVHATLTLQLPFCGHRRLDHFICEVPALLKLACVDTTVNELVLFVVSVIFLLLAPALILLSYGFIVATVLRLRSAEAQRKAFSTCSSHLAVVVIFYGTIIYMYLQPRDSYSQEQGKFISLFYTMVTPTLNPVIYTLRNKDVKGALRRLLWRGRDSTGDQDEGHGRRQEQQRQRDSSGSGSVGGRHQTRAQTRTNRHQEPERRFQTTSGGRRRRQPRPGPAGRREPPQQRGEPAPAPSAPGGQDPRAGRAPRGPRLRRGSGSSSEETCDVLAAGPPGLRLRGSAQPTGPGRRQKSSGSGSARERPRALLQLIGPFGTNHLPAHS